MKKNRVLIFNDRASCEITVIQEAAREPENNIVCTFRTKVQNGGWQAFKYNKDMSGTSRKSYRLEVIEINLENQGYDLVVAYALTLKILVGRMSRVMAR